MYGMLPEFVWREGNNPRKNSGHGITEAVSRWLPTTATRLRFRAACGVCGGQNVTGAGFSEYLGFPFQCSFHKLFHVDYHLSSGAVTIGQLVADIQIGLSLTPPQEPKKKKEPNERNLSHNLIF
jgi:hypothetical protein